MRVQALSSSFAHCSSIAPFSLAQRSLGEGLGEESGETFLHFPGGIFHLSGEGRYFPIASGQAKNDRQNRVPVVFQVKI
jgi:hypothetical protein